LSAEHNFSLAPLASYLAKTCHVETSLDLRISVCVLVFHEPVITLGFFHLLKAVYQVVRKGKKLLDPPMQVVDVETGQAIWDKQDQGFEVDSFPLQQSLRALSAAT